MHNIFNGCGPLWTGNLWDNKLLNKMYKLSLKSKIPDNELIKFLKIIKNESKINTIGFYDIHKIVKKEKIKKIMKKAELIKK